jgi:hypothetical protein
MEATATSGYELWLLAFSKVLAEPDAGLTVFATCTSAAGDLRSVNTVRI